MVEMIVNEVVLVIMAPTDTKLHVPTAVIEAMFAIDRVAKVSPTIENAIMALGDEIESENEGMKAVMKKRGRQGMTSATDPIQKTGILFRLFFVLCAFGLNLDDRKKGKVHFG